MSLKQFHNVVKPENRGQGAVYDNLRDNFAEIPDVFAIVLLSADGVAKCGYGLSEGDVETAAAACSGLASLGKGLSRPVKGGEVLHLNVTLENAHLIVTPCGEGSNLVAYVSRENKTVGPSIREIVRVARQFGSQMRTDARLDARTQ